MSSLRPPKQDSHLKCEDNELNKLCTPCWEKKSVIGMHTLPPWAFPADSPSTSSSSPVASRWEMGRYRVVVSPPTLCIKTLLRSRLTPTPTHIERASAETSGWWLWRISGAFNVLRVHLERWEGIATCYAALLMYCFRWIRLQMSLKKQEKYIHYSYFGQNVKLLTWLICWKVSLTNRLWNNKIWHLVLINSNCFGKASYISGFPGIVGSICPHSLLLY